MWLMVLSIKTVRIIYPSTQHILERINKKFFWRKDTHAHSCYKTIFSELGHKQRYAGAGSHQFFGILVVTMVAQCCTCVKIHKTVNFMVCPFFKKLKKTKDITYFITSYFTTFYYSDVLEVIYVYCVSWWKYSINVCSCLSLPNSMLSDITMVSWNWPWEAVCHRNWQMPQIRAFLLGEPVVKYLPAHPPLWAQAYEAEVSWVFRGWTLLGRGDK